MKTWIKLLLTGIACFAGGFSAGYIFRKKTGEIEIEEVSEEELQQLAENNKEADTESAQEKPAPQTAPQEQKKEEYFKRWKEETAESAEKYDTRTTEAPQDVVPVNDEDIQHAEEFMDSMAEIEPASIHDWERWANLPDGEYDPVSLIWYEPDNVVCDEETDEPLENSDKYLGFDIGDQFKLEDDEASGDPDVRIVYNHKHRSIFYIHRSRVSYSSVKRQEEFEEDDDERDDVYDWVHGQR